MSFIMTTYGGMKGEKGFKVKVKYCVVAGIIDIGIKNFTHLSSLLPFTPPYADCVQMFLVP